MARDCGRPGLHGAMGDVMMPHRLIHGFERLWAVMVALYEPAIVYTAAGSAAVWSVGTNVAPAIGGWFDPIWMQLFGFAIGTFGDLHARGRIYAKIPDELRQSRLREWKSRLGLAGLGLGFGVVLASGLNNAFTVWNADVASGFYPFVNLLCVLVAVPVIDGVRGLFRILGGESSQEAFAGLVLGWAQRRSGQDRPPAGRAPRAPRDDEGAP